MNLSTQPIESPGHGGDVELIAGVLCLDFVNTIEPRVMPLDGTIPMNYLTSYEELIAWGIHAEMLNAEQGKGLQDAAHQQDNAAQAVIADALILRETIYNIFAALAQDREADSQALDTLKHFYSRAIELSHLMPLKTGFGWTWENDPSDLMSPLWPIALSAIDLLMTGERERMKQCPVDAGGCGWLFYDTSKNNSRRWCSMRTCGMEAKERQRAKRSRSRKTNTSDS